MVTPTELLEQELWTAYAEAYDQTVTKTSFYRKLQDKAFFFLNGASPVLDVACGTGAYLERLCLTGKSGVGIDSNPEMLTYAKNKLAGFPEIELMLANSDDYNLRPREFEAILCMNALHAFPHPLEALMLMKVHLSPGGLAIFTGPKPGSDPSILVAACRQELETAVGEEAFGYYMAIAAEANSRIKTTMKTYSAEELSNILTQDIGFRDIIHADNHSYLGQSHFVVAVR